MKGGWRLCHCVACGARWTPTGDSWDEMRAHHETCKNSQRVARQNRRYLRRKQLAKEIRELLHLGYR